MSVFLQALKDQARRDYAAGETVIEQGDCTGLLFFLIEGTVAVTKDDVPVTRTNEAGAVFGDLSALLGVPHTAEVRGIEASSFYVVEDPVPFLESRPEVTRSSTAPVSARRR